MVKAWRELVTIPTYEVGKPEKTPMFLEKRVYQGSSGVVYPYPVIESISDEKVDKEYQAIWLENEYIKVMVLPELGGRIQMAYDKIARRHFVYYNHVIKPALVGLVGPWISGGIEFNWPQHHRPTTFMPVDTCIEENADGSVSVWVSEMERMFHQKGMAGFTLRPGCAYLEIKGRLYNRTDVPQTFLWWANPAVEVNDQYQSVFPPDINAVFDHGKRAVSSFPIATGTYYKMDYSAGVDISNYKNIRVPTSYMAIDNWECSARLDPQFPTVWRNLALARFNKQNRQQEALQYMERAFRLDENDERILMELDTKNLIHCKYMLVLGYYGMGDKEHAERYLKDVEQLDNNHQGIQQFRSLINAML